jgi:2-dehydro-3-deoxyphosphogluconate aldolase/(4S)-4-hydroxy-2-oxoglutarate aldolase
MHDAGAVLGRLEALKVIPVVTVDDAESAVPLAEALAAGGLPCIEIAFRTPAAADALRRAAALSDLLVGAGTVRTLDQAQEACDAGARFLVSPGVSVDVIEFGKRTGTLVIPGTATPTDIETALSFGLDVVKFFPAEAFGGVKTLKAVSGPYPGLRFIPTGGINVANLGDYLALPQVLACGGSWLAAKDVVARGDFETVTRLAREAAAIAAGGA